jgi:hypothetical protein
MTLVETVAVGSGGASSITFSSIPQTGTDLLIILSARQTASSYLLTTFTINGSTSNFIWRGFYGWAGSKSTLASGGSSLDYTLAYGSATANTFSNMSIYIPNYTAAVNKEISVDSVAENDSSQASVLMASATWSNTAAITTINLGPLATTYTENTIASLYLITKGSGGATVTTA